METVFDALKAMGKASSQEVAARLGMTRNEAINELWMLKRRGEADNNGPMWWLTEKAKNGDMSVQNAEVVQVGSGSTENATRDDRNRFPSTEREGQSGCRAGEFVSSIPSFTEKRSDDLIFPSLRVANCELRRAKSNVQKWQRVCAALRVLNQNKDILAQLNQESAR
ncbi:DUF1627 domain-containing protein [Cronobacter sp. EKM101R]|uniref:DUF1627 domain-containing protein n=2 Tax=unclassified Cronobacter TaxID=2649764 RepID=UPI001409DBA1|nr:MULTISPECIES: DUF1627 domain-containing protein [Cronobacter]KAF6589141.1 DUF1627 domain-containing protein [Cronobacter sp. EKM101R]MDK1186578.1 DUF1627 domain-containing protein [Cronobacter turicensis]MDK1208241.1 DUF1627 domain-containing protein [Cronobacter turicensis]MDK1216582.1 DUF1627 domain-containing protein [Cronobacter turicensis]MDK1220981.1 DUF1627 domain-containing protein [Cronobacter turicensis]